jgi:tetratricopeptide (TPR) repeat protein
MIRRFDRRHMVPYRPVLLFGIALSAWHLSLQAASSQDHAWPSCRDAKSAPQKVEACSRVIPGLRDRKLAERAYLRRGLAFVELRQFDQAIQDFDALIRLNGQVAGYFDNRMNAHRQKGDLARALLDADAAVQLAPGHAFVYRSRGIVNEDLGRYPDSIRDFSFGLQIEPGNAGLHMDRGRLLAKLGDVKGAVRDFTTALSLDPKWNQALKERGMAYVALGDPIKAKADLRLYMQLEPADADAAAALAILGPN